MTEFMRTKLSKTTVELAEEGCDGVRLREKRLGTRASMIASFILNRVLIQLLTNIVGNDARVALGYEGSDIAPSII